MFDPPAPPEELRDLALLLEALASGAGPHQPGRRGHLGRGGLARLAQGRRLGRRQTGRPGPVLRTPKRDRPEAPGEVSLARPVSGTSRPVEHGCLLRPVGQAGEEMARPIRDRPVRRRPDPPLHPFGPGRRPSRTYRPQGRSASSRAGSACRKRPPLRALAPAARTLNDPGSHQAAPRALLRLDRNRGLPAKAVAPAVVAETRRILDRQHSQPRNPHRRPRRCLCDTLLHPHLAVPQQPTDLHRARSAAPPPPDRNPPGPGSDKTSRQQPTRPVPVTGPAKRHSVGPPATPLAQGNSRQTKDSEPHAPQTLTHKTHQGPDVGMR